MSTMESAYARYVPRLIVRHVARGGLPPCPSAQSCRGAILFADVSGYTRLAEGLADNSGSGPEELSQVLNAHLGALVALVTAHHGDVLKFAGDALIALWANPEEDERLDVERAVHCASGIQRRSHASHVQQSLVLRTGVVAGDVVLMQLASDEGHREVVVGGGALQQVAAIQDLLDPGALVLSQQAWLHIADHAKGEPLLNGAVRLSSLPPEPPARDADDLAVPVQLDQLLGTFVAPPIRPRIDAKQTEWLAELRRVTVVFIRLPGLSHTVAPDVAQGLLDLVRPRVHEYGGSIHSISTDEKGIGILAAFGLPPAIHEDDPARGVGAALAIEKVMRQLGMLGAIGIATGPAFCGLLGTEGRRQYAVLGEVVNRASRLMTAGGEGPLCDEATYTASQSAWKFQRYPPIHLKGLSRPLATFRPSEPLRVYVPVAQSLVGRDAERRLLGDHLAKLGSEGGGGLILIEGEAGIGKTRLVDSLALEAQRQRIVFHRATAEAIDASTPYHAWRLIFSQLLDPASLPDDVLPRRKMVLERFGLDEEMEELLPLLNPLLRLRLPETQLTRQMEVEVRARSTQTLLAGILERILEKPALLLLENGHWFDSASWDLTRHCYQRHPESLIVLTMRREPGSDIPGPEVFPQLRTRVRLSLRPLSGAETKELVKQRAGEELPPETIEWIFSRSEGNPLFTEELVLALQQSARAADGAEKRQHRLVLKNVRFPDSLQGIILSRIDALAPAPQLCLKVASIFGRSFAVEPLLSVYPLREDVDGIKGCLELLEGRGLVRQQGTGEYRFQHALIQEATYGLLPLDQRRKLHRAAAEWYEGIHPAEISGVYPLLVHHWRGAGDVEQLAKYLDLAGHQALGSGAYREAIDLFEEAQLRVRDGSSTQDQLEWAMRERWIGEAEYGLGRLAQSQFHLSQSIRVLDRALPASTGTLALAVIRQILVQVVRRTRGQGRGAPPAVVARTTEACLAYERVAEVGFFLGESLRVFYDVLRNLNLAEAINSPALAARSYGHMSTFLYFVRARRLARFYEARALAAARESEHDRPSAHVFEAIALSRVGTAEWSEARDFAARGAQLFLRMGDRRKWAECSSLQLIPALQHRGEYELFESLTGALLTAAVRSGDRQVERWVYYDSASMYVMRGEFEEARRSIRRAVELLSEDSSNSDFVRVGALNALISIRMGDRAGANHAIDGCIEHARANRSMAYYVYLGMADLAEAALARAELTEENGGATRLPPEARIAYRALRRCAGLFPLAVPAERRIRGRIEWVHGHPRRAARAWRQALAVATRQEMMYERGLAHSELGLRPIGSVVERRAHLERAEEILAGVGATYALGRVREARSRLARE